MAKHKAPASLTGGKGFNFEDLVAGRFLLDMLAGLRSIGPEYGRIIEVHWQVRDAGWLLDDLALTLETDGLRRTVAMSVKSHRQVTRAGFPDSFVTAAWEQWLGTESTVIAEGRDLLGLVTGKLANEVWEAWETLATEANGTSPERMVARLQDHVDSEEKSQSSRIERALFSSMRCPESLCGQGGTDQNATVRLIRHIRLWHFDFEDKPSRDEARAVSDCQHVLRSAEVNEAESLWKALLGIAAESRGQGGSLTLPGLLHALRDRFALRDYPDHRSDWETIHTISSEMESDMRTDVGGLVSLARIQESDEVRLALERDRVCLLVGPSGCGKSGLAKLVRLRHYPRVVWPPLTAIAGAGHLSEFHRQIGLTHPLSDLLKSSANRCLLVFDSIERYSDTSLRIVGRILRELYESQSGHVHVLLTTQPDGAARAIEELSRLSGRVLPKPIVVGGPSDGEVLRIAAGVSGLPWATIHRDLLPLLKNLKILDWVVLAAQVGAAPQGSEPVALGRLIDFVWERWVERGEAGFTHGAMLQTLGDLEAQTLSPGVPIASLDYDQSQALNELQHLDLIRVRSERVLFAHDLLGDWARLRALLGEDPVSVSSLRSKAALPRWHAALRLYARNLLDTAEGAQRWRQIADEAPDGSNEGQLLRDAFLEAVIVAENSRQLLEIIWPAITANGGKLLNQLLDRFLYVATVPDRRFLELAGEERRDARVAAAFRSPFWPYWGSMLNTLWRHHEAVIEQAPLLAAQICRMWLEKMPWEFEAGRAFPWREQATDLALAIAREVQAQDEEGRWHGDELERTAYEAALLAASDRPEEASAVALELCRRRPLRPDIQERAASARQEAERLRREAERQEDPEVARRRRRSLLATRRLDGPLREPWPDGPRSRVPEPFQEACLDGQYLLPLIVRRPDVALEVLLAVCIEEPKREDPFGGSELFDTHGVEHWHGGYPPLYFRGPFLHLLRESPEHGLSFVLRLVNFATHRWVESERRHAVLHYDRQLTEEELGIRVRTGQVERHWLGDSRVFRWYLDWPLDSRVLSCALMALEKWLDEQLEKGANVDDTLNRILAESESVAFGGLLLDVGKRRPESFVGPLRSLLTAWELYYWDQQTALERRSGNPGMIGWWGQPQELVELARAWFMAPHRTRLLLEIAVRLLLTREDLQSFFQEIRQSWSAMLDEQGEPRNLRLLVERLTRENYSAHEQVEGAFTFEWPEDLRDDNEQAVEAANEQMQFITFPVSCRQILDGQKQIQTAELPFFWDQLMAITAMEPQGSEDESDFRCRQRDAVCGGIAVLICLHGEWLRDDAQRAEWCRAYLVDAVTAPSMRREFDTPNSAGDWHWDVFLGEAGIALLAEDTNDSLARTLVALGVTAYHHGAVRRTMRRAFELRARIGEEFNRVKAMALLWSGIHALARRSHQLDTDTERWRNREERLLGAFIDGRLPCVHGLLVRVNRWAARAMDRLERKRFSDRPRASGRPSGRRPPRELRREPPAIDVEVLRAAFDWVNLHAASSPAERSEMQDFLHDILDVTLRGIEQPEDVRWQEMEGPKYEFDQWLLDKVARGVATTCTAAERAAFWRPLLDLGRPGHRWIEQFFWAWFIGGLQASDDPSGFSARWTEMVEYALAHPLWDPAQVGTHDLDEMVSEMLGFGFGIRAFADDGRFATELVKMKVLYQRAAAKWFHMGRVANGFAAFVSRPCATPLLKAGVTWLHDSLRQLDEDGYAWRQRDIEENLVGALQECWRRHSTDVKAEGELRSAFLGLINMLCARGNHAALVLRDEVGSQCSQ